MMFSAQFGLLTPNSSFSLNPSSPDSLDGEVNVDPLSPVSRKRSNEETIVRRKPKSSKMVQRPHEDYGDYDPNGPHPVMTLSKFIESGKKVYWFFILTLLTDPTKKGVISWTGRGYEFIVLSQEDLIELWRQAQEKPKQCLWDSLRRNFRSCYKRRIMIPVDARKNTFAFITEPSVHLSGWTKTKLVDYIKEHQLTHSYGSSVPHYHSDHISPPSSFPTPPPENSSNSPRYCPNPIPFPKLESSPVSSPVSLLPFSISRILGL